MDCAVPDEEQPVTTITIKIASHRASTQPTSV
jgi:hypothetical protein